MAGSIDSMPYDADARRLALEAITTLAYVKKDRRRPDFAPAGVPDSLIREFIKGRDPTNGDAMTKRQSGIDFSHCNCGAGASGLPQQVGRKRLDFPPHGRGSGRAAPERSVAV